MKLLTYLTGFALLVVCVYTVNGEEKSKAPKAKKAKTKKEKCPADTEFKTYGTLGIGAMSHINIVVHDSVDEAINYYTGLLGFEETSNDWGPMDYRDVFSYKFCIDAGLPEDCGVDIVFLKHEIVNIYLELFYYHAPDSNKNITIQNGIDAGGIRHFAFEVFDAVAAYNELKSKDHQGTFITQQVPILLDDDYDAPLKFFYWIDKYGVQWEFEEGRPVEYSHIAGITGWNLVIAFK